MHQSSFSNNVREPLKIVVKTCLIIILVWVSGSVVIRTIPVACLLHFISVLLPISPV